nr:MAG TPA: hypothetical protein [Caudoviricetes sp.]DAR28256.1 MAG TPA: hypothetical protein [Caudoviricetes sp.]
MFHFCGTTHITQGHNHLKSDYFCIIYEKPSFFKC